MVNIRSITLVLAIAWLIVAGLIIGTVSTSFAQISLQDAPRVTYTPRGQIEWKCNGSGGDEIITVKKINSHNWDFFITPNPSRLSSSEIQSYPLQSYYWITSGTNGDDHIKVNTDTGLVRFYTIPDDAKTLSAQITDKTVDLTKNRGIRVTINDPRWMDNVNLHIGVHSATYTAVSNVVTVTGSPVSYQDIYDALLIAHPGTSPWHQLGTRQFFTTAKLYVGNDVTPTLLTNDNCQLSFADGIVSANYEEIIQLEDNAIWRDTGGSIIFEESTYTRFCIYSSGGDIQLTGSDIGKVLESTNDGVRIDALSAPSYIRDSVLYNVELYHTYDLELTDTVQWGTWAGMYQNLGDATIVGWRVNNSRYNVAFRGNTAVTIRNAHISEPRDYNFYLYNNQATATLVNCFCDDWYDWSEFGANTHGIERQHTLDLKVCYPDGTPHLGAVVTLWDSGSQQVYNGAVSAAGTIPSQALDYEWLLPGYGTRMFSPYDLRVQAVGYNNYTAQLDMGTAKSLEVTLCPLSFGGTTAGDVLSWCQNNVATISWWEENMSLVINTVLFLGLALLALWAYKRRIGWLSVVAGISVVTIATSVVVDSGAAYGFPYVVVGIGVFFVGIMNIRKMA